MKLQNILQDVADFQNATDQVVNLEPTNLKFNEVNLRYELMKEENEEYFLSGRKNDLVEVLDACTDKMYILLGTINSHGLGGVFEEAFKRVHANNMTKVGADGKVVRNGSGKIMKPKGFKAVDLSDLV